MRNQRTWLLHFLIAFCQRFGTRIIDSQGKVLGRALIIPWRGKVHLIGLPNHLHLRPVPLPQTNLRYWCQTMGWSKAPPPDFPRLIQATPGPTNVCHIVICHLGPNETAAIYQRWKSMDPSATVLIAYGGTEENFRNLPSEIPSVYVTDPTLRTIDHVRERQQYTGVFQIGAEWISRNHPETSHVHIAEFDVIPVAGEIGAKLVASLEAEAADLAGFGMVDFTGTIHPHNSYELARAEFFDYITKISCREVRDRLLVMLGCSSIWTRNAFDRIAGLETPREYLEMAMPTLAHHLGFRVRPLPANQEQFVTYRGDRTDLIPEFTAKGAWLIHPCKKIWSVPR